MKQLLPQAHPEQSQGTPGEKSHLKLKHSSKQRLAPLPVHKLYGSLPVDTFGNSRTRRSMDARLPPSLSRPHPSGHGTAWPLHHKPSCSTLETLPHSPVHLPTCCHLPYVLAKLPTHPPATCSSDSRGPVRPALPPVPNSSHGPSRMASGRGGRLCPPALQCPPTAAAPGQCPSWEPPSLFHHLQAWPLDGFSPKMCPFS